MENIAIKCGFESYEISNCKLIKIHKKYVLLTDTASKTNLSGVQAVLFGFQHKKIEKL